MKKIVDNGHVKMEWDADWFIESKKSGFVAAIQLYNTSEGEVPVVFQDNKIFYLWDNEESRLSTKEEVLEGLKESFKEGYNYMGDYFEENTVVLGYGYITDEDKENAYSVGLTDDDIQDINNRNEDLQYYFEMVYTEMY